MEYMEYFKYKNVLFKSVHKPSLNKNNSKESNFFFSENINIFTFNLIMMKILNGTQNTDL